GAARGRRPERETRSRFVIGSASIFLLSSVGRTGLPVAAAASTATAAAAAAVAAATTAAAAATAAVAAATTAAAATAVAAATTAAAAAAAAATLLRLVDLDRATVQLFSVHLGQGRHRFLVGAERYESEAARAARLTVGDDLRLVDVSES